ncbi:MAG: hypothetical protein IJK66_01015 [Bacilli bacterium]|nr:hypothetical protein [Bacilli bacterium]
MERYKALLDILNEKIMVLNERGIDVTDLLSRLEIITNDEEARNLIPGSVKYNIYYENKVRELSVLINRIDNMTNVETHNKRNECNVDFEELFNRKVKSNIAVTCITNDAIVTRYANPDEKYHFNSLAHILYDLTGNEEFKDKVMFFNNEYKDYCIFIRYVDFEDYTEITIDLPYIITKGMIDGLSNVFNLWKSARIDEDSLVQVYVVDEEFNKKYNPSLDGIELNELDKLLAYLKIKEESKIK